ncbi:uncharacterized protein TNCV_489461 [Trichonephila clavipes]|nr:uncharacterized protein TNCV_489461 [Trichonephila clavipes]
MTGVKASLREAGTPSTIQLKVENLCRRPISPLSSEPDLEILTPAHFLIGRSMNTLPETDLTSWPDNRLSHWQDSEITQCHNENKELYHLYKPVTTSGLKGSFWSSVLMTFVEEVKRKKPKNYRFHYEWESEFLFTMSNGKCTCLICHATVAISKKSNLRRHFSTMHKNFNELYPENSSARAMKVVELKSAFPASSLMDDCVAMGLGPTKPPSPSATSKYYDFFPPPEIMKGFRNRPPKVLTPRVPGSDYDSNPTL